MRINDAFPSQYLKSSDLNGKTFTLQISSVMIEEIQDKGKAVPKPILYFQGAQKGMVLNRTNAEAISMVLGDETNDWIGHKLELFTMRVQGPQGMTDGLRCRVVLPQQQATPAQKAPAPEIGRPSPALPPVGTVLDDSIPF